MEVQPGNLAASRCNKDILVGESGRAQGASALAEWRLVELYESPGEPSWGRTSSEEGSSSGASTKGQSVVRESPQDPFFLRVELRLKDRSPMVSTQFDRDKTEMRP